MKFYGGFGGFSSCNEISMSHGPSHHEQGDPGPGPGLNCFPYPPQRRLPCLVRCGSPPWLINVSAFGRLEGFQATGARGPGPGPGARGPGPGARARGPGPGGRGPGPGARGRGPGPGPGARARGPGPAPRPRDPNCPQCINLVHEKLFVLNRLREFKFPRARVPGPGPGARGPGPGITQPLKQNRMR